MKYKHFAVYLLSAAGASRDHLPIAASRRHIKNPPVFIFGRVFNIT